MSGKYIVRQPIKDAAGGIIGNEILYHGANQAFSSDSSTSSAEFAAANTIYNFLTQNSPKVLKGTLNFMTFTTMLLMKKTPRLFDKADLVIQIDDAVIIHPLSMHLVQQYVREGYRVAVNEFQFTPRYLSLLDDIHFIKINGKSSSEITIRNTVEVAHSMNIKCIVTHIDDEKLYQRAVALGADGLILVNHCADPFSPKTVRSTMGACFRLPVYEVEAAHLSTLLKQSGLPLYATALREDTVDITAAWPSRCAVAVGSEGRGVSPELLALSAKTLKIPMRERCESLNAAVAAAIVLWEMARQPAAL